MAERRRRKKNASLPLEAGDALREIIEGLHGQIRRVSELANPDLTVTEQVQILNSVGLASIRLANLLRARGEAGDERSWWEKLSRMADEVRKELEQSETP